MSELPENVAGDRASETASVASRLSTPLSSLSSPSSPEYGSSNNSVPMRKRGVRCGECVNCLKVDDCGKCLNCRQVIHVCVCVCMCVYVYVCVCVCVCVGDKNNYKFLV